MERSPDTASGFSVGKDRRVLYTNSACDFIYIITARRCQAAICVKFLTFSNRIESVNLS